MLPSRRLSSEGAPVTRNAEREHAQRDASREKGQHLIVWLRYHTDRSRQSRLRGLLGDRAQDVRVANVGDRQHRGAVHLATRGAKRDVVAAVVVDSGLRKHRIVLDLGLAEGRAVARDEDQLGCEREGGRTSKGTTGQRCRAHKSRGGTPHMPGTKCRGRLAAPQTRGNARAPRGDGGERGTGRAGQAGGSGTHICRSAAT